MMKYPMLLGTAMKPLKEGYRNLKCCKKKKAICDSSKMKALTHNQTLEQKMWSPARVNQERKITQNFSMVTLMKGTY